MTIEKSDWKMVEKLVLTKWCLLWTWGTIPYNPYISPHITSYYNILYTLGYFRALWVFFVQVARPQVVLLTILKEVRKPWMLLEQPRGSWLLKLPAVVEFKTMFSLNSISTHMCFWDA